jgi:hypothetical protein
MGGRESAIFNPQSAIACWRPRVITYRLVGGVDVIRVITLGLMAAALTSVAGAQTDFDLELEKELRRPPVDPRTENRLAQWNSPMGRLMYQMQEQHASLMRGNQPGGAMGLGFRLRWQGRVGWNLVASPVDSGIEMYERSLAVVRWPWQEPADTVMTIEQQVSTLLGRRLSGPPDDSPPDEEAPK